MLMLMLTESETKTLKFKINNQAEKSTYRFKNALEWKLVWFFQYERFSVILCHLDI